ncbi:MAG: hypothetical protein JO021_19795 [Alphaproteobacteria bacterium]|nr:hypothetical protein [Alphaproteobacteria bacterium]
MRKSHRAQAFGLIAAVATITALAGCDTNYYGDSGRPATTTTTTYSAPPPPAASSTTTVQPNPDGSVTTTERSYRRY